MKLKMISIGIGIFLLSIGPHRVESMEKMPKEIEEKLEYNFSEKNRRNIN